MQRSPGTNESASPDRLARLKDFGLEMAVLGLILAVLLLLVGSAVANAAEPAGGIGNPSFEAATDGTPEGATEPQTAASATRNSPAPYDHGDPTAIEQYMLELVNRARKDPAAEADRFGIGLNDGLSGTPISPQEKQPLAFSPQLLAAARGHSQWMIDEDRFSHTGEEGSSPSVRTRAAGYPHYASVGENIAWRGWTSPIAGRVTEYVAWEHEGLFKSPSHRYNSLRSEWQEAGIGCIVGVFSSGGNDYHALMTTQDLGHSEDSPGVSPGSPFLTGVVYEDRDGDGFYTPGEGVPGVVIEPQGNPFFAVSSASGGYAIPIPGAQGSLDVLVYGENWTVEQTYTVEGTGGNVKLDLIYDTDDIPQTLNFVISQQSVPVDEGMSAALIVHLSDPPRTDLQAIIERTAGDLDIRSSTGPLVVFPAHDDDGVELVFVASEDSDTSAGTTTFSIRPADNSTCFDIEPTTFTLTEVDDDITITFQASGNGAVNPGGTVVFDTNDDMPVAVEAMPTQGAVFLAWQTDFGSISDPHSAAVTAWAENDATITGIFSGGDFDADSLDDGWEYQHFGGLDAVADGDPDGDGHANWIEAVANLDPKESNEDLEVTVLHKGWNVFVPHADMDGMTLAEAIGDQVDPRVWRWDALKRNYVRDADVLSHRKAAWILVRETVAVVAPIR